MTASLGEVHVRRLVCKTRPSQSQEGMLSRKAQATSVRSSSEGLKSRERAWLKGHQGVRRGSKASKHMVSARTQRDPGRQSLGKVALGGWVALRGQETSGECRRESARAPESNSEAGPKPEEGHRGRRRSGASVRRPQGGRTTKRER